MRFGQKPSEHLRVDSSPRRRTTIGDTPHRSPPSNAALHRRDRIEEAASLHRRPEYQTTSITGLALPSLAAMHPAEASDDPHTAPASNSR